MSMTLPGPQPRRVLALAAALAGLAGPAFAAQAPASEPEVMGDLSRRDIRVPQDEPNISGTWLAGSSNRTIRPVDGAPTPFLPWAREFFEARVKAEAAGTPAFDPNASCLPAGMPRTLPTPYPVDIVQVPGKIIIAIEVMHNFRVIHMNDKPMPEGYKSYFGYSRGRWEGDTLVIETTGINGYTYVDEEGRPKSNQIRVVERMRKVAPNVLENTFTIYDPVTYAKPWTARARNTWSKDYRLSEYVCEENNRNRPDSTGILRPM